MYAHQLDAYTPPDLPLWVEAGPVKEGDRCDGQAGLTELALAKTDRFTGVTMDEPLVAGIWPYNGSAPWPHQAHCEQYEQRMVIFKRIAAYVVAARSLGLCVGWYEAWPHHPMELWVEALWHMGEWRALPDRLILDYNPWAGATAADLKAAVAKLRTAATLRRSFRVDLCCVVMGFDDIARETTNDALFISHAIQHYQALAEAGPWDRIVVQSWLPHGGHTVPSTDALLDVAQRIGWLETYAGGSLSREAH